ncbi:methyltransferase type 12 [Thalassospira sp. MA62]|nr:methyltransferase type 12 [Thalassospira sp. MA62]
MTSHALSKSPKYPVQHVCHADWSRSPNGRWIAKARRQSDGWIIHALVPVGDIDAFVQSLITLGQRDAVWLGLDMPIGFVDQWFDQAGFSDFHDLLGKLGTENGQEFFRVCETRAEISPKRPFYPARPGPKGTVARSHLVDALGFPDFNALHRHCEHRTTHRGAACPSFWTLGANQVGKAMLHGLEHLIVPGAKAGFNIWPFDGDLAQCSHPPGVTLIETYPAEIYHWLGIGTVRKSRQDSRKDAIKTLIDHARQNAITFDAALKRGIADGLSHAQGKDDAFDALVGVMGMIMVADGRWPENLPDQSRIRHREGWILGLDTNDITEPPTK